MKIIDQFDIKKEELLKLYKDNGWVYYMNNMDNTVEAYHRSFYSGLFIHGELIGVIRYITDTVTILYIQDLLIQPQFQSRGYGTKLLSYILEKYSSIYQTVLLTDHLPKYVTFYQKFGFKLCDDMKIASFLRMNKK